MARKLGMYLAPVLVAALLAANWDLAAWPAPGPSRPSPACTAWTHTTSPNTGTGDNNLTGVAATSAGDAWAVGYAFFGVSTKTLAEHWNGKSWRIIKSPNTGTGDEFKGIYTVSPTNACKAVGSYFDQHGCGRNLIEHWNGKSWSAIKSPNLGARSNELTSIRGNSANDIWAVGDAVTSYPIAKTVILHWNGMHWRMVSSPSVPAEPNFLAGVRPLSPAQAWAVGRRSRATPTRR